MNARNRWMIFGLFAMASGAFADGAKVMRCEIGGKVVYSDTACAQSATKTEVDTELHNISSAPELPSRAGVTTSATQGARSSSRPHSRTPDSLSKSGAANQRSRNNQRPATASSSANSGSSNRGGSSPNSSASIAETQAQHKADCQRIANEIGMQNARREEERYDADSSGRLVNEQRAKSQAVVDKLDKERKQNNCR